MSFNIESVKKFYDDPHLAKLNEMSRRLAKLETDNVTIETDDLRGLGDLDRSKIRFYDRLNFHKKWNSYNSSASFDGLDDYIDCGNNNSLWSRPLSKFSLSFWFYPTAGGDGNVWRDLVAHGDFSNNSFNIFQQRDFNDVTFESFNNSGNDCQTNITFSVLNKWHFVLCTYDSTLGSNQQKIYFNGVLGGQANQTGALNKSVILSLGGGSVDNSMKGNMKDFRWWNDIALTQVDAINLANRYDYGVVTPNYWLVLDDGPTNPIDNIGGLTATLTSGASFTTRNNPVITFEPDYNSFALDLRFNHLGNFLTDYSGFNTTCLTFGEPCMVSGIDVGYLGGIRGSPAHSIEQDQNTFYTLPDDDIKLQVKSKTTGHSMRFLANWRGLATGGGGTDQKLWEKWEDASDANCVKIGTDGKVKYMVKRAGTDFYKETASNTIVPNATYDIVVTYAVSGNVQHVYVNNVDKTLSTTSDTLSNPNATNATIGSRPNLSDGRLDLNFLQNVRFYDEKVLSSTNVYNLFNNKVSISSIDMFDVCLLDGCVFAPAGGSGSFTTDSFTTTSFTAI